MAYKVTLLSTAVADLAALPQGVHVRIADALRALEQFPHASGVKKLRPPFGGFRKRVGDYRILFDVAESSILIHRIKNRKDAYRV